MRILGIDPGTRNAGVGIIEAKGSRYNIIHFEVIKLKANQSIPKRLYDLHQALLKTIKTYTPEVVALEDIFFGKDLRAMIRIGEARACAMLAASAHGLDVVEYPPARVKQSVTGNGRASKDQMQHMVKTLLSLKTLPPPDAADALAVALCHAHCAKKLMHT